MKRLVNARIYQEDKLVIRWVIGSGYEQQVYFQGKRLPKAVYEIYPWVRDAVRIYVKSGTIDAIKFIRQETGWSILQSKQFIDSIR